MDSLLVALSDTLTVLWLVLGAIACWLVGVIITHLLLPLFYPPNVARLGCWVALTLWLAYALFFVLGMIANVSVPQWLLIAALALVLLWGIGLWFGKRTEKV